MSVGHVHLISRKPMSLQQCEGELSFDTFLRAGGFREPGYKEGCWGKVGWIFT